MPPKKPNKRRPEAENTDGAEGPTPAKVPKAAMFLAQEARIISGLLSEDKAKRMHQVRKLPQWFTLRGKSSYPFAEEDLMRIWKALLHTMRMSDQPQVQEELVEQAAQMVDSFGGNTKCSLDYFSAFMRTMSEKSCAKLRSMDKLALMLVRRMLRHVLRLFKQTKWSPELIAAFNKSMQTSVLSENPPSRGLTMHYLSIFFKELAKEADGDITAAQVNIFLLPFVTYVATQRNGHLVAQCRAKVLHHLLYQSDMGRGYSKKFNAWQRMGFPTASIDDFEISENETFSPEPLAGNVDWELPVLPLEADCVLDELKNLTSSSKMNRRRRKFLCNLIQAYETYKSGKFPFGVSTRPKVVTNHQDTNDLRDATWKREIAVFLQKQEKKGLLQKTTKSRDPQLATPQPLDSGEQVEILSPEQQLVNLVGTMLSCIEKEMELVNELAADEQTAVVKQKTINEEKTEEQPEQLNKDEQPETTAPTAEIKPEPRTNTGQRETIGVSRSKLLQVRKYHLLDTADWVDRYFEVDGEPVVRSKIYTACVEKQAAEKRNENGEPKEKNDTKVEQHNAKNPAEVKLEENTHEGGQSDPKNDVQPQTSAAAKASSKPPRKPAKTTNKPGLATHQPVKNFKMMKIKIEPEW